MPNWSGENPDSSARYLDIFDKDAEDGKLKKDAADKSFMKSKVVDEGDQ